MSTVFGALDAHDEGERRVPPAGWSSWDAFRLYLADADGGRAPYREAEFAYPPDTTPTFAEMMSREEDR